MSEIQWIPETIVPGKRLGRHIDHAARRSARAFEGPKANVVSVTWPREIPILNQGNVGSCTGNAATGAVGTLPVYSGLPVSHPALNEAEAVRLYSAAETIDGDGPYPPNDNGSTGPSVAQATQNAGLILSYNHYIDLDSTLQALMRGPVIIGISWYTSFDTPSTAGLIEITPGATVRGGHEVVVRIVNTESNLLGFDNSWGLNNWTPDGSGFMSIETFTTLLDQGGDTTAFNPLETTGLITVPGLEGHSVKVAEMDLENVHLTPEVAKGVKSTARVKGTSPKAGVKVATGTKVTILT